MFVRASLYKRREEYQLDATECFIALTSCSTCFGHLYAHNQELENRLLLLPHMVCNFLCYWWSAVRSRAAGYASGVRELVHNFRHP